MRGENISYHGMMTMDDSSRIKVALMGCGRIAQRHAAILGGGEIEGASLCAVCDILGNKAQELGQKYGVESFDGLWKYLEQGKITESECFDDLTRFEYLEIEKEKVSKLLHIFEK